MLKLTSKERVDIHNKANVENWCSTFGCTESELFYCMSKVGSSVSAIESYLTMNRNLIQIWTGSKLVY